MSINLSCTCNIDKKGMNAKIMPEELLIECLDCGDMKKFKKRDAQTRKSE